MPPLLLAWVTLAALPSGDGALGKVAVLDVQGEVLDDGLVPVLSEVLAAEASRSGRFRSVIAARDVKTMLSFEERRQVLGCSDEACLVEIGGALGADRLLVSSVTKVGARYVLTLKLIDITAARTDARDYRTLPSQDALLEAMPAAVRQLLFGDDAPAARATAPTPAVTADPFPTGPVALFAVGAVGLAVGVGFGLDARAKRDTADAAEAPGSQRAIGDGRRSQTLANVGYGVGAAAAVAGALWWWLGGDDAPAVAVGPRLDRGAVGAAMGGRF